MAGWRLHAAPPPAVWVVQHLSAAVVCSVLFDPQLRQSSSLALVTSSARVTSRSLRRGGFPRTGRTIAGRAAVCPADTSDAQSRADTSGPNRLGFVLWTLVCTDVVTSAAGCRPTLRKSKSRFTSGIMKSPSGNSPHRTCRKLPFSPSSPRLPVTLSSLVMLPSSNALPHFTQEISNLSLTRQGPSWVLDQGQKRNVLRSP